MSKIQYRPRLTEAEYKAVLAFRESNESRVLFIGDLHEPFTLDGYLEFCKKMYDKYNCNQVVFSGDIIDNHFSSYHESDPDGHAAGAELAKARENIKKWHEAFPYAKVAIGNHDAIPNRKAMTAGILSEWIKPINQVLEVPTWDFAESFEIDGVMYCHGIGGKATQRAKNDLISVCQGHYHSESYINFINGRDTRLFALQVGCGLNEKSYAAAYGKHGKKMHINCGIIIGGKLPILEYMD